MIVLPAVLGMLVIAAWAPGGPAAGPVAPAARFVTLAPAFRGPSPFAADTPVRVPAGGREPDPWLGEDKLKHFLLSFAVSSMGYAAARTAGLAHASSIAAGAGAGAAAGIWKEAHDRATGGDVSARDLAWDAAGIAAGGVLSAHTR